MSSLLQKAHFTKTGMRVSVRERKLRYKPSYKFSNFLCREYLLVSIETTPENEFLEAGFWSYNLYRLKASVPRDMYTQFDARSAQIIDPYEAIVDLYHVIERDMHGGKDYVVLKLKNFMDGTEHSVHLYITHGSIPKNKSVP